MSSSVSTSTDAEKGIVEEIESHMGKYMSWLYSSPYSRVEDEKEFLRLTSNVPNPFCNFLFRLRFSEEDIESRMEDMMRFFESRSLPTSCWVGPCCGPASLGKHLVSHGFILHKNLESMGMTIDLEALNEDLPVPEGLSVKRVEDDNDMRLYLSPFERGFEFPKDIAAHWGMMDASHGFDASLPRVNYVALINGVPASCTALFKTTKVAGIYCVATAPEMRRKGAATALIVKALRDARDEGLGMGLLQAKAMGASVYRRLGFVDRPCKFDWYTWQPSGAAQQQSGH